VAHVANTGGRAVDLSGTARLTGGPGNTSAGPFRAQQIITLAPGQSGNLTFGPPKSLPNGPWRASITVLSGLTTSWRDAPPAAAAARQPDARPAAGQRAGARPALTSTDHERTRRKLRLQNVRNSHPLLC
jgi:hypothetical protein